MLVIVHHRDVELFLQSAFDFKTLGSLDVFQVDTTESRGDGLHGFDEFFWILFVHFDVENIDSTVYFEQKTFSFHHRFTGHSADVAQSQYGSTVRDDGHQVSLGSIFVSVLWILLDFKTRLGYTR